MDSYRTKEGLAKLRSELETRIASEIELWLDEHLRPGTCDATALGRLNGAALNAICRTLVGTLCGPSGNTLEGNLLLLEVLNRQMQDAVKAMHAAQQRKIQLQSLYAQFHSELRKNLGGELK